MTPALAFRHVSKRFGDKVALSDVSFTQAAVLAATYAAFRAARPLPSPPAWSSTVARSCC